MKRLFDIFFSLILFLLTLPLIFIFSFLILIFDLQNPFFIQERSGIYGKSIKILKLQTMKYDNNKKKITKLGKLLRFSKIDELPQLLSVIKNDMSLIGPRPLYIDFNQHLKKNHSLRLSVKPGLTGLAQIKVNDSTDWKRKFNFDAIYTKKASFSLDIYIIVKTLIIIFNSIFLKNKRAIESIDYKKNFFDNYCK